MEKISLFSGINSIGMPFTRENKKHIGYFDIVKKELIKEGYEVDGINISSLNKNHTWDLERIFNSNYSLAQIRNIQMYSIDELRNTNKLFRLVVPKELKERFIPNSEDSKIIFKDVYVNSENPIFIYTAGVNDFFSFIQASPVELMDKNVREKLPNNLNELVAKSVSNVEKNILLLHELNQNVSILVLSFYYSPLFDLIQKIIYLQEKLKDRDKKYINRFEEIIVLYNYLLKKMCKEYDFVQYIDINFVKDYCAPMDFHPNTKGNELIANEILKEFKLENHNRKILL